MRSAVLFTLLTFFTISAFSAGTPAYDFLRADVSARAAALGGSFLAMSGDPNLLYYNPAGLATLTQTRLSFGFFKHLMDINAGHATYATEIKGLGSIAAGVLYTNYGSFKQVDENGVESGTFGAGDFAATAGFANNLRNNLSYGVSAKFIYSSIAGYSSTAAAVDFGLRFNAIPERMVLAASLLNVGTQLDPYLTTRDDLPMDLRVGFMLTPEHLPAMILFDLHDLTHSGLTVMERLKQFTVGVEFTTESNLHLRFGYNNSERTDFKIGSGAGLAGLSIGGGITTGNYTVDYAFNSLGKVGALHRISVGMGI